MCGCTHRFSKASATGSGQIERFLAGGVALGDEIVIDCKLMEIGMAR